MRTTAFLALLAGCGTGLECGRGTIERDGKCVAIELPGDDDDDDTVVPGDDDDDDVIPDGPLAVVTPPSLDLGEIGVACPAEGTVTVSNGGDTDLVIGAVSYDSPSGAFALDAASVPALPLTLPPGEGVELLVTAVAADVGFDSGQLVVLSNDPVGATTATQSLEGVWGEHTETFTVSDARLDVMLLIDHSCSMEDNNRAEVEAGIPELVAALDTLGDWQLAEVTRDNGCATGGIVDTTTPNVEQLLVDHAWDADPIGPGGAYLTEALLQLAGLALDQTDPGECNEGLLRPGTPLHILVVSDEREQSGFLPANLVALYQSYVPDVVVSGILDVNFVCGDGTGGAGYVEAVNATGGVTLDICTAWGAQMDDLVAGIPAGPSRAFELAEPAMGPPLEVLVDGVASADFTWDGAQNLLVVGDAVPDGATVEVTYPVAATCP